MSGASDQFGDDEDDDEGWLTQSTFGLSSGPFHRTERRPVGHGFVKIRFHGRHSFMCDISRTRLTLLGQYGTCHVPRPI